MSVVPDGLKEQIQFCETHLPVWTASPGVIGLTSSQVANLASATTTARASYNNAEAARLASKSATATLRTDVARMTKQVRDLVRQIKAFAELQAVPAAVYAASQIPLPADGSPLHAPGIPTDIEFTLNGSGSVTLSWSADDAAASTGAFFMISRKLPGQSDYTGIGGTAGSTSESRRMTFTDNTLPASAAGRGARYIIQGFRGTRAGEPSAAVTVQFGVDDISAAASAKTSAVRFAA